MPTLPEYNTVPPSADTVTTTIAPKLTSTTILNQNATSAIKKYNNNTLQNNATTISHVWNIQMIIIIVIISTLLISGFMYLGYRYINSRNVSDLPAHTSKQIIEMNNPLQFKKYNVTNPLQIKT